MQMLLKKMHPHLNLQTGSFDTVLKKSFEKSFALANTQDPFTEAHLATCYLKHQQDVFHYFSHRNDLLKIDLSHNDSLPMLLRFLSINSTEANIFPRLNRGKQVDHWKNYKHPNKINSYSAGIERRKFFDYL